MTRPAHPATVVARIRPGRPAAAARIPGPHSSPARSAPLVTSLLSSKPVLWFLFAFNLVAAVAAGFALHGAQQVMTGVGLGAVAIGAGAALLGRRGQRT